MPGKMTKAKLNAAMLAQQCDLARGVAAGKMARERRRAASRGGSVL